MTMPFYVSPEQLMKDRADYARKGIARGRSVVVGARALANAYAQTLGTVFTTESKPLEVELVVAEVGRTPADDQIYRLSYDGSVADEHGHVVMGGQAEHLSGRLSTQWTPGMGLADVVQVAVAVLGTQPD